MVQHRAALQAERSLTFKIASGAIAASNIPKVANGQAPLTPSPPGVTETAIEMPRLNGCRWRRNVPGISVS
jgi:hypothetical protein